MKYIVALPIETYQVLISPVLRQLTGATVACRYEPSCSVYFEQAVTKYGMKGMWLGLKRLLRCHPWSKGGFDPVVSEVEP